MFKRITGRPPGEKNKTIPKTYCFFVDDVNEMVEKGYTPRETLRQGLLAKRNNPAILERVNELERMNKRLSDKLQRAFSRLYELEGEIKIGGDDL